MNSHLKTTRERPRLSRLTAALLMLAGLFTLASTAKADFSKEGNPGFSIISESLPNGSFDPGEVVTVRYTVKNTSGANRSNVDVRILPTSRIVTFVDPSGLRNVGTVNKDATFTVEFTFTVGSAVPCGGTFDMMLRVLWNTADKEEDRPRDDLTYTSGTTGTIVDTDHVFSNTAGLTIPASGKASVYPVSINVSGVSGTVSRVAVTLNNLSHSFIGDIDMILVGPGGQKSIVISDIGGQQNVSGLDLTLDNKASASLPIPASTDPITSSSYKPANYGGGVDTFADGPDATGVNADLTTFKDLNPNGEWTLYIVDDSSGGAGSIGTISLNVITSARVCLQSGIPVIASNDIGQAIPEKKVDEDPGEVTIPFDVDIVGTALSSLTFAGFSSDTAKIPESSFKFEGSGNARTFKFKPAGHANGTVTITLRVNAPNGNNATTSFNVVINAINDAPKVTPPPNQARNIGTGTGPLPVVISDVEQGGDGLLLTASSNNQTDVPNGNIFLTGSGGNRTIEVVPANGDVESVVTITLTVTDSSGASGTGQFKINFGIQTGFPTVNPINDTSTNEDTSKSVTVTVSDAQTPADSLIVSASFVVNAGPNDLITLGLTGSGSNRTLTMTPKANASGNATITVRVRDGNNNESMTPFILTVTDVNDKPTVTSIGDIAINEDSMTGDIGFTIGDVETPVDSLVVTITSSDTSIVPNDPANIIPVDTTGDSRSFKLKPLADQFGRARITVMVEDAVGGDGGTVTTSFDLNVTPVNDKPGAGDFTYTSGGTVVGTPPVPLTNDDPLVIEEDSGDTVVTLNSNSITVGPANEVGQSISVSAVSSDTSIIKNPKVTYTSPNTSATFTFKPEENKSGTVTITVTVKDNGGTANGGNDTTTKSFKVTVAPINDAPTISDIPTQNIGRDETVVVGLTVGDIDSNVNNLVVTATSSNTVLIPDGSPNIITSGAGSQRFITLTPALGEFGTTIITAMVSDGSLSATDTFTVNVSSTPPNRAPTITSVGDQTKDEDQIVGPITVTVDDLDEGPADLTVSGTSDNQDLIQSGNIVPTEVSPGTWSVLIVPNQNANGVANVTLTVRDTDPVNPRTASRTFKVTINPVEDIPTIAMNGSTTVTVNEDTATSEGSNGSNTDSNEMEFNVFDPETPAGGFTFEISSSDKNLIPEDRVVISHISGQRHSVEIKGGDNRNGTATVTIRAVDTVGLKATLVLNVTINAINDPPTLDQPSNVSVNQGTSQVTITLTGVTPGGGSDESGQVLTFTINSANENVIADGDNDDVGPIDSEKRASLVLTVQPNAFGSSEITLTADDGQGANNKVERKFTVSVGQVNAAPTIATIPNQEINMNSSTAVIAFTVADAEAGADSAKLQQLIVTATSNNQTLVPDGNITLGGSAGNRSIKVTPAVNQFGVASITVTVTDTGTASGTDVKSASTTFQLTVNQTQLPPTIGPIPDVVMQAGQPESDIISFNVGDLETPAANLVLSVVSIGGNPGLIKNGALGVQFGGSGATRLMVIQPTTGQTGFTDITVRVTDGNNESTSDTFRFTVLVPNNDPTITNPGNVQNVPSGGSTGPRPFSVSDTETALGLLTVTGASDNQTSVPNGNIQIASTGLGGRTVNVTGAPGSSGTVAITLTVHDGPIGGANTKTDSETFTVSFGPGNTDPSISSVANQTTAQDTPTPVVPFTVSDAETALAFLNVTGQSSNTALVKNSGIIIASTGAGNRTVFVIPEAGQSGSTTITLTVTDAGGLTASTSFTVTVNAGPVDVDDDLDNDGNADLVLQDAAGFLGAWFMNGSGGLITSTLLSPNHPGDSAWRVAAVANADFNNDGHPDLLFQKPDGTLAVWTLGGADGVTLQSSSLLTPASSGAAWRAVDTGDFNGDGNPDILFQNSTDGTLAVWRMNGLSLNSPAFLNPSNPGAGWSAVAVADVNKDGNPDVVFQHTNGNLAVWRMNGINLNSPAQLNPAQAGATWRVAGSTDLNNDGHADLIFQNSQSNELAAWYLNGINLIQSVLLSPANPGGTWKVVGP